MKWTEIYNIAIELQEQYPDEDVVNIAFTKLQKLVLSLSSFDDKITNCNEKVLEAIQQAWLEEKS